MGTITCVFATDDDSISIFKIAAANLAAQCTQNNAAMSSETILTIQSNLNTIMKELQTIKNQTNYSAIHTSLIHNNSGPHPPSTTKTATISTSSNPIYATPSTVINASDAKHQPMIPLTSGFDSENFTREDFTLGMTQSENFTRKDLTFGKTQSE